MKQNTEKEELVQKESEIEYVIKAKTDNNYKQKVVDMFMPLVHSLAAPYARSPKLSIEDLRQQGILGILRAIEDFDVSKQTKFATYARYWILGNLRSHYINFNETIRVTSGVLPQMQEYAKHENALEQKLGRAPTIEELSESVGVTPEKINYTNRCSVHCISISSSNNDSKDSEDFTLSNLLPDNHCDNPRERFIRVDGVSRIKEALNTLTSLEQAVIIKRYGLDNSTPKTLNEVGADLGVTYEWVRVVQNRAERKLKKILEK